MAKATFTLPNGTGVTLDGDPEEIRRLLELYGGSPASSVRSTTTPKKPHASRAARQVLDDEDVDLTAIVSAVKSCDEADAIESAILDKSSQVNRTLLPLYIVQKHLGGKWRLTSGEINKITVELGIPVSQPNVSHTLSGSASKFVMGDKLRKKGGAVRYRISRRGLLHIESV